MLEYFDRNTRQTDLRPFWCQALRSRRSSLNIETISSYTGGEGIILTAQPTTTETFIEETVYQYKTLAVTRNSIMMISVPLFVMPNL